MNELSLPQKAAVVLAQLDERQAMAVLRNMSEAEVIRVTSELASLPVLSSTEVEHVVSELVDRATMLSEVRQGGTGPAERLLKERLGPQRADEIMEELRSSGDAHPLAFINHIDPAQIAGYLKSEHPQTLAIVLAHLRTENAARIIERLDDDLRSEVARRVAKLPPLPPEVVRTIARELEERLSAFVRGGGGSTDLNGVSTVVGILNNIDRATEKQILSGLDEIDPEMAERVRNELFIFDDVLNLDDQTLQLVLRNITSKNLAMALKGKPEHVIEKFTRNISERAAEDLAEDIATLGPQRLSLVEQAEAAIVKQVRTMADAGTITIERGSDELVA
jgi:flagellar motor switch protein FliG